MTAQRRACQKKALSKSEHTEIAKKAAARGQVARITASGYGVRYRVNGVVETPDGRNPRVWTVWIIDNERGEPRLITAHPLRGLDA